MRRLCVFALGLLVLVSCNNGPAPGESVAAAAERSIAQGTAKTYTNQTMEIPPEAGGGSLVFESTGVIDFDEQLQHATMTTRGLGGAEDLASRVGDMELISSGFVIYMRSSVFQQLVPGAKEWVKIDLQAAGEEMGLDLASLGQTQQGDPGQQLRYLEAMEDVEEVGTEEVRGTETTHYEGVVSFDALADTLPEDARATVERLQDVTGMEEFEAEVWLDEEGLARRIGFVYDSLPIPTATGDPQDGQWTMTIEFFDFGDEVSIELPPKREVTDLLEVLGGAQQ